MNFRGLRPRLESSEEPEKESVKHLQELYTVAVGLALTVGVERALPAEGRGDIHLPVSLVFAAFVATLVPFYHGAQRHLDLNYRFNKQLADPAGHGGRTPALFFGDFLFLFIEGCLMIAMGASVETPQRFLLVWLLLIGLDVMWLTVFVTSNPPEKQVPAELKRKIPARKIQQFGWAIINVPAVILGSALLFQIQGEQVTELGAGALVLTLGLLRTAADYAWNWHFYFPVSPSSATSR
jgi:hypothetical protein